MHPADPRVALLRDHLVGYVLSGTDGVRFHLREFISEGGQGWVYKGNYDEPDGIPIVVKVLRPDGMTPDTLRRFQREATILRQLGAQANPNPNLVRFYDHGIARLTPPNSSPADNVELPFTVLEYVHGVTLAQIVLDQRGAGLAVARARRLLRQVAWALTSVHGQNIVHRDLKPSNVLVTSEHGIEIAKVTDFGLAKLAAFNAHKTTTLAGASLGYAPPEQYEKGNERVTPRTDLFSLGVILFECMTGTPAYLHRPGDNPMRLIEQMVSGPRPSLAKVPHLLAADLKRRPDLVAALDVFLAKATQAYPEDRPASVREFWDSVEPLLRAASEPSQPPPPGPGPTPYPPRPVDARPHDDLGRERITFRTVGRLPHPDRLRTAAIAAGGRTAYALGALGIYRWVAGVWTFVPVPRWLDANALRGMAILGDGSLLAFGDRGTIVTVTPNEIRPWHVPDDDLDLAGAFVDRAGVMLVGWRRRQPLGAFVEATFGRATPLVRTIETSSALRGVARLADGSVVACGDDGVLARVDLPTSPLIPWGRTGHLLAIVARPEGGAFVVGTGGHALALSSNLQVKLEAVQTTRDLSSIAVSADGSAWAGAAERRILQRRGTTWTRMPLDVDMDETTAIIAVHPSFGSVMAIASDGQMLEGRPYP